MSPSQELRIIRSTFILVVGTCSLLVVAAWTFSEKHKSVPKVTSSCQQAPEGALPCRKEWNL
jgi:hypothetical protein